MFAFFFRWLQRWGVFSITLLAVGNIGCQRSESTVARTTDSSPASTAKSVANQPSTGLLVPQKLPAATPGLELQDEDYAKARKLFRSRLLREKPSPQSWMPVEPPVSVSEVEYASDNLKLKAWINRPRSGNSPKPAVLFLHGGLAFGRVDWDMTQPIREAGFVVMMPLLRGENGLPGTYTMFYQEVDDVLAAADVLAKQSYVSPDHIYLAGYNVGGTLALLAAMTSGRFRAAVSFAAYTDQADWSRGQPDLVPFDRRESRELQMRSPVAFATSFKCPIRMYYSSGEYFFHQSTQRTAMLAQAKHLDVAAVVVPGDQNSSVLHTALKKAIEFFREK